MKLLFDQNISYRIIKKIENEFPGAIQVKALDLEGKSDLNIWTFRKKNNYSIVTFDTDFFDMSILKGYPPKIIWLRTGNSSTLHLADLLIKE